MSDQDGKGRQEQSEPAPPGNKKPYQQPSLTVFGKIDEITLSGPGHRAEAGSGKSHP